MVKLFKNNWRYGLCILESLVLAGLIYHSPFSAKVTLISGSIGGVFLAGQIIWLGILEYKKEMARRNNDKCDRAKKL
jgi:hypothetical protein